MWKDKKHNIFLLLAFTFVFWHSCSESQRPEALTLEGTWKLCSTSHGEQTTMYNICPKVSFKDKTGVFKEGCHFNYHLKSDSIFFTTKLARNDNCFFGSSNQFSYTIKTEENFSRLEIFSLMDSVNYTLYKETVEK